MNRAVIGAAATLAALFSCSDASQSTIFNTEFTDIVTIESTPVKDQDKTSTCWCFSAIAQIEAELLAAGKGELDLSEMFVVRHTYFEKAVKFARLGGNLVLSERGEPSDTYDIIEKYGIVTEKDYPFSKKHSRGEIKEAIQDYMDNTLSQRPLPDQWQKGLNDILDKYFGELPDTVEGFTPKEYAEYLGIRPRGFSCVTSFSHHPFYSQFILELPDNWSYMQSRNLPLDKMIELIDSTLESGHTVLWGADVSEPGYHPSKGYAILFDTVEVSQQLRQKNFDNLTTTDDHDMLIVGYAVDSNGNKFYKVKNSYGSKGRYKGFFYASEAYVRSKTILIVVP